MKHHRIRLPTHAPPHRSHAVHRSGADLFDRVLSLGAIALLLATLVAVARGRADWSLLTVSVWLHLGTVALALALTPAILLRRRGDRLHRALGWAWSLTLIVTALVSFAIRFNTPGRLSWIHLLSVTTLVLVAALVLAARARRQALHRGIARTTVVLTLLVAGFFTFPFGRLLGRWLFGA